MSASSLKVLQILDPVTPVKNQGICHDVLKLCSPSSTPTPPKKKAAFARSAKNRNNAHKQQLRAKANFFNKSGFAKNSDYILKVDKPSRADKEKRAGKGAWKKLTVECIL
jgi:hypothetical protein